MQYRKEVIKDYAPYQVDTNGVIYSKTGHPLKYSINHRGYCIVNFYINHKRTGFAIHTLVAKQFLPQESATQNQVNHINGIKTDNRLENLEWVTGKENMLHAINTGLYIPGVQSCKSIIGRDKKSGEIKHSFISLIKAAKNFNPAKPRHAQNNIWRVLRGRAKSYKGCTWEYSQ